MWSIAAYSGSVGRLALGSSASSSASDGLESDPASSSLAGGGDSLVFVGRSVAGSSASTDGTCEEDATAAPPAGWNPPSDVGCAVRTDGYRCGPPNALHVSMRATCASRSVIRLASSFVKDGVQGVCSPAMERPGFAVL